MKIKMLQDYEWAVNDEVYKKDQIIEVQGLLMFPRNYARYFVKEIVQSDGTLQPMATMDWIPKELCEVIE